MAAIEQIKLTPWYGGKQSPARPGVYQRDMPQGGITYSRFDGERWRSGRMHPQIAADAKSISSWQSLPWRGFSQEVAP